jgi:hypothetical protein
VLTAISCLGRKIEAKFNIRLLITNPDQDIGGFEVILSGPHLQTNLCLQTVEVTTGQDTVEITFEIGGIQTAKSA